jgi:O-antigen/teichoic acid export membrane protein
MLTLEQFGHYMLATLLVSGLYLFIIPVYNVIYPKFSSLISIQDDNSLRDLYTNGTRLLASVIFPIASILAVYSYDIIALWTSNSTLALEVAPIVSILSIGSAIHGVMYFQYALQLASGKTNLALKIYITLLILMVPLTLTLTIYYGVIGGALSWLILHMSYMLLSTYITHKELLKSSGLNWLKYDVGLPLLISTMIGGLSYFFIEQNSGLSVMGKLIIAFFVLVINISISVLTSTFLRGYLNHQFRMFLIKIN